MRAIHMGTIEGSTLQAHGPGPGRGRGNKDSVTRGFIVILSSRALPAKSAK
jgi:hypothetical protein